jgi:hypothetical protein
LSILCVVLFDSRGGAGTTSFGGRKITPEGLTASQK